MSVLQAFYLFFAIDKRLRCVVVLGCICDERRLLAQTSSAYSAWGQSGSGMRICVLAIASTNDPINLCILLKTQICMPDPSYYSTLNKIGYNPIGKIMWSGYNSDIKPCGLAFSKFSSCRYVLLLLYGLPTTSSKSWHVFLRTFSSASAFKIWFDFLSLSLCKPCAL